MSDPGAFYDHALSSLPPHPILPSHHLAYMSRICYKVVLGKGSVFAWLIDIRASFGASYTAQPLPSAIPPLRTLSKAFIRLSVARPSGGQTPSRRPIQRSGSRTGDWNRPRMDRSPVTGAQFSGDP